MTAVFHSCSKFTACYFVCLLFIRSILAQLSVCLHHMLLHLIGCFTCPMVSRGSFFHLLVLAPGNESQIQRTQTNSLFSFLLRGVCAPSNLVWYVEWMLPHVCDQTNKCFSFSQSLSEGCTCTTPNEYRAYTQDQEDWERSSYSCMQDLLRSVQKCTRWNVTCMSVKTKLNTFFFPRIKATQEEF